MTAEEPAQDPQLARYSFQRKLEEIAQARGRATELISLYVPPGKQISDVMAYLRNEYAQSSNIKSRTTRKNVMWAIDSLSNRVRSFKEPPPHGVAFFVGSKAVGADKSEPVTFIVEPPEPLNTYLYRCDSTFFLEPLRGMVHEPESWGLIVMDRAEVTIGLLRGKRIETLRNRQSQVPSKHGRGGQSAHRFERMIEHAAHEFFVRIAEIAAELFLPMKDQLKGILLGGPGATDEYGLKEMVEKATQTLHGLELTEEKRLIQRLLSEVRRADQGLAAYGEVEVERALELGAVDLLIVPEGLKKRRWRFRCSSCGAESERIGSPEEAEQQTERPCGKCGQRAVKLLGSDDYVEELFARAARNGGTVRLISTESDEGEMLLKAFGGIAAILRYPLPRRALPSDRPGSNPGAPTTAGPSG